MELDRVQILFNNLVNWCASFAGKIILALIVFFIAKKLINFLLVVIDKALEKSSLNVDMGIVKFVCSMCKFALYIVLVMVIIDILGFQTTSFIAFLGSAGLAIGMSLQGSLANFAGGILILISKPFTLGDYIVVGSNEGTVIRIDLLYTRLRTVDNKIVVIPNGSLANSNIVNVAVEPIRRVDIQVGIAYGADIKKARKIMLDINAANAKILKDKEVMVHVVSLDDSSVTLESRTWVKSENYWDVRFALIEQYKEKFAENDVEIPFPQIDVHMKND